VDDIFNTTLEVSGKLTTLGAILKPVAERTTLEEFKQLVYPKIEEAIYVRVTNILLYQKAKREASDKIDEILDKEVDKAWRGFILEHNGNEADALDALRQQDMTKAQFLEHTKRQILTEVQLAKYRPKESPIGHRELLAYYDKIKDEFFVKKASITFRLIDIRPSKLTPADPNADLYDQARQLARDLLERLKQGEDFGTLAKEYSHGHRHALNGLWRPVDPASLAPPYDILVTETKTLQAGDIAGPIETPDHIFIIRLEHKQEKGYELFEMVQDQIETRIREDRRQKALDELNKELSERADVGDIGVFINTCLEDIYRRSQP
jgi:parvulin-like peptidyl-prolyl isomerase